MTDPTADIPQEAQAAADAVSEGAPATPGELADPIVDVAPAAPAYPPPAAAPVTLVPVFANGKPMLDAYGAPVSDKSRLAAALLCWFLGVIGVHRFYVGKIGTGVAMVLTLGGLGIWALVDLIMILVGSFRDSTGKALQNW